MILVMGMLAFIINVGLFVKAKINLQNATDAAAYSGASVQARQLTNIAYANWELRNVYKEWLFKYYVLGQISLFPDNFRNLSGKGTVSFRLPVSNKLNYNASTAQDNVPVDAYNLPSICIHNNTSKSICGMYLVPGLPRFKPIGVGGITQIHDAIVSDLVSKKSEDCSVRSAINFLAALNWTYGSGDPTTSIPGAPEIASGRPGAWPNAVELAMRIRNLEMIVNRPPIAEGIDYNTAMSLAQTNPEIALNERPYKAFLSAYRNLSGGKYKDQADKKGELDELSSNFKLYEIKNNGYDIKPDTASSFLIPSDYSYQGFGGAPYNTKPYLDLQVMPLNFALMYSTFTSASYDFEGSGATKVEASGACGISKTALPVPGYILGFVKNPEVLTYYAVKGESRFIGLFFPFSNEAGIKLTAYSAAKPFGGRIGPRLFDFENNQAIKPRKDLLRRSVAYFSGVQAPPAGAGFKVGYPIPFAQDFWAYAGGASSVTIGGIPGTASADKPKYGIPNIIYDFDDESDLQAQSSTASTLQNVALNFDPNPASSTEALGLYGKVQFRHLAESFEATPAPGTTITSAQITDAIIRARRPTRYEALNYLIPDFENLDSSNLNQSVPFINKADVLSSGKATNYKLFAPLVGPSTLYKTPAAVEIVINTYISTLQDSVKTYLESLHNVAQSLYNKTTSSSSGKEYQEAALTIHANAGTGDIYPAFLVDGNCKTDIASKFNHFFRGKNKACGMEPLEDMMVKFVAKASENDLKKNYYFGEYYFPGGRPSDHIKSIDLMTAYYPNKRHGADQDILASVHHPLGISSIASYSSRRNYYSTKFVQLAKLLKIQDLAQGATRGIQDYTANPVLKEGSASFVSPDMVGIPVQNYINFDATSGINNNFYLDF